MDGGEGKGTQVVPRSRGVVTWAPFPSLRLRSAQPGMTMFLRVKVVSLARRIDMLLRYLSATFCLLFGLLLLFIVIDQGIYLGFKLDWRMAVATVAVIC